MSFVARMRWDLEQVLFPSRDRHAIPSMDGPLSPNDVLDRAKPLGGPLLGADDAALALDGRLLVSAGHAVYRFSGPGYSLCQPIHSFEGEVGAIAQHPDGRLLVCVADQGLWSIGGDGNRQLLHEADGLLLTGLTAVAVAPDGTILLTQGSRHFAPSAFLHDLMHKNKAGALIACAADLGGARILVGDLAFPAGVCIDASGGEVWFTQAWTHSLHGIPIAGGMPRIIIPNLPGYPGRISRSVGHGFYLCIFAIRTHLTELVLREDEFRTAMMAYIDPIHWIGPALATTGSYYEPLQAGNVKKLGVLKPWAPPRSYGLIVELDELGEPRRAMHSRVGGAWHGITAATQLSDGIAVVSKGSGRLLRAHWEEMV